MTEEQEKQELLNLGEELENADTNRYIQARKKWMSEGYFSLKKIFPHLKIIADNHCTVFGYEFFINYKEDEDNKKIFYLTRVGGDQAGQYQPSIRTVTHIITREDMARMLKQWATNERYHKEWVESQKANKSKNRGFFRDFFNL